MLKLKLEEEKEKERSAYILVYVCRGGCVCVIVCVVCVCVFTFLAQAILARLLDYMYFAGEFSPLTQNTHSAVRFFLLQNL